MTKPPRERRLYDQECGLAYGLDVVGERWTLLIIRELLPRPRRFRDLLDGLPGIGTNLLAERLSSLAEAGVVEPLEPGRRTAGYALTELGRTLHEPILGLARFGLRAGAGRPRPAGAVSRASWAPLAIEAMLAGGPGPEADETYQFDVGGEVFHVAAAAGRAVVRPGPAAAPDVVATTDPRTFFDLGLGRLDPIEALVSGAVRVTGRPAAVPRCLRLIGFADAPAGHGRTA
ncbi:winged helix-turn-helix transcriptional regulator [Symbioplanes lichenis]|uniref:winged helix-turn-helix transcriptional regulator n=1 Tax=Symbioplanes lichenis TaxID=1629072 RepID=UPI0027391A74|nr:helix-turn-helix domain-containing protein [Actinoplanes lichenis]